MGEGISTVDHREWDWLPQAADEAEAYLLRLLTEAAITAHNVIARAKSIGSFQDKCARKQYTNPRREVTDTVAVRIITYSVTDRNRAAELIRDRFEVEEDRNPGESKQERQRGYDCQHFVVTGESSGAGHGWMIVGGKLSRYFEKFGRLEIQIRTVAAHAWAEFEHSRRYKGQSYQAISDHDQLTIDQLFGAAADARRALDGTYVAIDRLLANPTSSPTPAQSASEDAREGFAGRGQRTDEASADPPTPIDPSSLADYLAQRFPDDEPASEQGMQFACSLVIACEFSSLEALSRALDAVDDSQIHLLMDTTTSVTRVRRLDDSLLARFGESYISITGALGNVAKRAQQLEWRYDRLRGKVRYSSYEIIRRD